MELLLLSFALSMDSAALNMANGARYKNLVLRKILFIAFMLGFFQFIMPLVGYFLGISFAKFISSIDHFIAFFIVSLITACVSSLRGALLFVPVIVGTVSALAAFSTAERLYEARYRFTLVPIRPARAIPFFTKATFRGTAACASSIAVLFAASLLSSFSVGFAAAPFSRVPQLEFPSARAQSPAGSFPTLDEYVAWCWNTKTAPYRSVNAQSAHERHPKTGDSIVFPRFSDGDAGISETSVSMVFDKNFYDAALGDIDALPYPAVEKLIKAQGSRVHAGYAFSVSGGGGLLHTLLVAFALCIPSILLIRSKLR